MSLLFYSRKLVRVTGAIERSLIRTLSRVASGAERLHIAGLRRAKRQAAERVVEASNNHAKFVDDANRRIRAIQGSIVIAECSLECRKREAVNVSMAARHEAAELGYYL